ncbi:27136_t:CDS:2, partial [Gigaspora margarita]
QEKFNKQVKNLKHKNSNKSDLEIYLEIAKNYPKFHINAKYKNLNATVKFSDEESALKLYKEIANNQIKESEKNKNLIK